MKCSDIPPQFGLLGGTIGVLSGGGLSQSARSLADTWGEFSTQLTTATQNVTLVKNNWGLYTFCREFVDNNTKICEPTSGMILPHAFTAAQAMSTLGVVLTGVVLLSLILLLLVGCCTQLSHRVLSISSQIMSYLLFLAFIACTIGYSLFGTFFETMLYSGALDAVPGSGKVQGGFWTMFGSSFALLGGTVMLYFASRIGNYSNTQPITA